ncbi:MAG: substrate-binding domain-containing protein [Anaerolineales bacterium]|nr:substrate-binding domain-containing protein [Anaerolineales bacterium]MCX7756590.1 substrate-binding domain-containing protein [Anaerolineales bacterium]MDW8277848.1 substrate-binding domain-containing protein [Anaerolineales bacterium]
MYTPRINWILLILFGMAAIGVFVAALLIPSFRAVAYAPLREILLPPPAPVIVTVLYSTEKQAWLEEVVPAFEQSGANVNGHPVKIQVEKMGSWEVTNAVLDGTRKPVLISPASMLQIAALQDTSTIQFGRSLVNPADTASCRAVLRTPLVLVAWKERADVLWGQQPGASLWPNIHDALVNPKGWAAFNQPDWGYIKFGHTDPLKSNSGYMTILLMTYGYYGKTSGLTAADILNNSDYQKWFLEIEASIGQFEHSTGPLMQKMIAYGPSTYDFVAVYESTAIEQAANAVGRYGELRVYYPPATLWSDHPFCILEAEWVTPDQRKAAALFLDYLTSKPVQEVALLKYGYRPIDSSIPLEQPGSPFERYAANGFRADLSFLPEVQVPPGSALNTLRDFWARNVSR